MVSLVVILGAVHGIVLLPVLLSIMGPGACAAGKEKSPDDSTRSVDILLIMHSIVNHKRRPSSKGLLEALLKASLNIGNVLQR